MPGLQTFGDFDKEQANLMKHLNERDKESLSCPTCDSQWFTETKVTKFKADHHVIVGQVIPPSNAVDYILLKCIRCEELLEPRILHNSRDVAGGNYDDLLDTLEGKKDKRDKPQTGQPPSDQIQSQRL